MKKIGLLIALITLFIACDNAGEKKAQVHLQAAKEALAQQDFNLAKQQIDSIKIRYPKAFEARKAGAALKLKVEQCEQIKTIAYLDSTLEAKTKDLEQIREQFVFEKDVAYQDLGIYFYPTQTLEKNINRSYLRAQVDELGLMRITSIYCGASPIKHNAVKVMAPDGTFAQTPPSTDRYESKDLGVVTERADYLLGEDGDLAAFIAFNGDKKLRVEYLGGNKTYTTTLTPSDQKAFAQLLPLAQTLSAITQIKEQKQEAQRKLEFVNRRLEEKEERGDGELGVH